MTDEKNEAREFWIEHHHDGLDVALTIDPNHNCNPITHVIEYSAYQDLELDCKMSDDVISKLEAENAKLRAYNENSMVNKRDIGDIIIENKKLTERIKALRETLHEIHAKLVPKIPTQPYKKEMAQKITALEAENEKIRVNLDSKQLTIKLLEANVVEEINDKFIGFIKQALDSKLIQDTVMLKKENEELKIAFSALQSGFELDKLNERIKALRKVAQDYASGSVCEPLCNECWPCDFAKALIADDQHEQTPQAPGKDGE